MNSLNKICAVFCDFGEPSFMGIFETEDLALNAIITEIMMMDRLRKFVANIDPMWHLLKVSDKDKLLELLNQCFKITIRMIPRNELDPLNNRYYRNLG